MFYHWHLAPLRLAKIYPSFSPICWKCKQTGTFFHMWCLCPKAKTFWNKIKIWLQEITKEKIEFKPEMFLLEIMRGEYKKEIEYLIIHMLTAARITYVQNWKVKCNPTDNM
uniref:Reverse transcriptase zinc-binding domain-containing protein n=1 Tax=Micrurus spixii TaxID=129469 RepID=A0A2D4LYR7_9SAUR